MHVIGPLRQLTCSHIKVITSPYEISKLGAALFSCGEICLPIFIPTLLLCYMKTLILFRVAI